MGQDTFDRAMARIKDQKASASGKTRAGRTTRRQEAFFKLDAPAEVHKPEPVAPDREDWSMRLWRQGTSPVVLLTLSILVAIALTYWAIT